MTPTIDERLASIVRALTEVILPHLPPEASLAQEQTQLAIGHLQIIRAQLDASPAYEREELDDAIALGKAIEAALDGGAATSSATQTLAREVAAADGSDVRAQRQAIQNAIDSCIKANAQDGTAQSRSAVSALVIDHERSRTQKDRAWFAPFGFDTL